MSRFAVATPDGPLALTEAQYNALLATLVAWAVNEPKHPSRAWIGARTSMASPWAIGVNSVAVAALEKLGLVEVHVVYHRYESRPTGRALDAQARDATLRAHIDRIEGALRVQRARSERAARDG